MVYRQHLVGETPQEIAREFRFVQEQNPNCKKNTLSFVLSPTVNDGKALARKELDKICSNFMEKMNLGERQAIAFVHRDKQHLHIHLYVNRIDFNGNAYKDSFIGKRSQQAAEKVAEYYNLTTVRQLQVEKEINLKDIRAEIKRRHDITMKNFKPRSFDQYIKAMETNGVKVIPCINKANKLQGFRFEFDGYNLKGSEIHRSMSGGNIGKSMVSQVGIKTFLKEHEQLKMAGKAVQLSDRLAVSITKHVIKRIISQGLEY
ncbi:relaxase/mobilization nuclease domain-containing protein [Salinimicrobium sp. TIG7-5_MAKvit]|uniref:relaxase/mobilization nuclease domain-containing protein n=1 Tax=Salinimicrobium sp. TIG7-5_MAKvit TaxID=3121289 RepID=UPI003C6DF3CD